MGIQTKAPCEFARSYLGNRKNTGWPGIGNP